MVQFLCESPKIGIRRKLNGPYYCVFCVFRCLYPGVRCQRPSVQGRFFYGCGKRFAVAQSDALRTLQSRYRFVMGSAHPIRSYERVRRFLPLKAYSTISAKCIKLIQRRCLVLPAIKCLSEREGRCSARVCRALFFARGQAINWLACLQLLAKQGHDDRHSRFPFLATKLRKAIRLYAG